MIRATHALWKRFTRRSTEERESGRGAARSRKFKIRASVHQGRQIALSIPHYFKELSEIRRPSELYSWLYFKFPNSFPLKNFPTYVSVEPTNKCNFSCRHCWRAVMDRQVGSMEVALFEKIARELSLHKPARFKLGGHGEPAIHPHFRELMALLPHPAVPTMVYTNGSLLRLFPHREILSWGLHSVVVSVDGLDAGSYEKFKIGGNYALLRNLVMDFYRCRKSSGRRTPIIEIRHVIMPNETVSQLLGFRKTWLETADTVKFNYLEPPSGLSQVEDPSPPKCRAIRRELTIQWDGSVPLCGVYRRECVGNVRDSTISELWRHPRKDYLRECNDRRDFEQFPLCMKCCHCR